MTTDAYRIRRNVILERIEAIDKELVDLVAAQLQDGHQYGIGIRISAFLEAKNSYQAALSEWEAKYAGASKPKSIHPAAQKQPKE